MVALKNIPYKWLVAMVFVAGLFMDIMDSTVVNVALPTLGRTFNARNTSLEWVVTGYLLSLAVWIPASGWLGDRFGTKRVFMFALAMFTLGSALCGRAWSIDSLIAFRVLQGIGGGMLTPVGTAMLYRAFPADERAAASAVLVVPTAIAPTIGPILGGWLVDNASWRWIFYINLPVGVLAFLFSAFILREHTEESVGRFDLPGFLLAGAGLPLMLYALSEGPTAGWTSARVLGLGLLGIALMAALIIVELRVRQPMLALRLFSNRSFRTGNLAVFIMFGGLLGVLFLLPLYLQQLRGLSAFHSGLTTFPQALGMVLTAQLASRLYPIIGPRRMVLGAMAFGAFVTLLFARVGLDTNLWWIRGLMFMRGITMGFSMIPVQAATYATIKPMDTGRASSLFSTNRQVAGSLGVALLATVLVDRSATHVTAALRGATSPTAIQAATAHGTLLGFQDAFFIAAFLYALGFAFAFLINDADAAPSMRRRGTPARQTTQRTEEAVAAGSVAGPAGALEPARRA